MNTLFLVACVSMKQSAAAPAGDLYVSPWFKMARRLVIQQGAGWFILSAKHGVLSPTTVVKPYNITLSQMSAQERRAWASQVHSQLDAEDLDVDQVTLLAGRYYREGVIPWFQDRGISVHVPMAGLGLGEQLSWLKCQTEGNVG